MLAKVQLSPLLSVLPFLADYASANPLLLPAWPHVDAPTVASSPTVRPVRGRAVLPLSRSCPLAQLRRDGDTVFRSTCVLSVSKTHWSMSTTSMTGNGKSDPLSRSIVGDRYGYALINLPNSLAGALYAQVAGAAAAPDIDDDFYWCPCASAPPVALGVYDHKIGDNMNDLNLG
ncbi:hypothetical protein Q5752_000223 [Cryptotrichosporon argae]